MTDPASLPIRQFARDILAAIEGNDVIVVIGETGSGKTTQLSQVTAIAISRAGPAFRPGAAEEGLGPGPSSTPSPQATTGLGDLDVQHFPLQILYEAGYAKDGSIIGVTQPRRVVSLCRVQSYGGGACHAFTAHS